MIFQSINFAFIFFWTFQNIFPIKLKKTKKQQINILVLHVIFFTSCLWQTLTFDLMNTFSILTSTSILWYIITEIKWSRKNWSCCADKLVIKKKTNKPTWHPLFPLTFFMGDKKCITLGSEGIRNVCTSFELNSWPFQTWISSNILK